MIVEKGVYVLHDKYISKVIIGPNPAFSHGAAEVIAIFVQDTCYLPSSHMIFRIFHQFIQWISDKVSVIVQGIIEKENNFKQPGERYRSWAPDKYILALHSS
jgi:hypothetical protein